MMSNYENENYPCNLSSNNQDSNSLSNSRSHSSSSRNSEILNILPESSDTFSSSKSSSRDHEEVSSLPSDCRNTICVFNSRAHIDQKVNDTKCTLQDISSPIEIVNKQMNFWRSYEMYRQIYEKCSSDISNFGSNVDVSNADKDYSKDVVSTQAFDIPKTFEIKYHKTEMLKENLNPSKTDTGSITKIFHEMPQIKNNVLEYNATSVCLVANQLYSINSRNHFLYIYQMISIETLVFIKRIDLRNSIEEIKSKMVINVSLEEVIYVSNHLIINIWFYKREKIMSAIYKFKPIDESLTKIDTLPRCRISSTNQQTILARTLDNQLIEFSTDGEEINRLDLSDEVNSPVKYFFRTALQLNNKTYVFTSYDKKSAIISVIDFEQTRLKCCHIETQEYIQVDAYAKNYIFVLEIGSGKLTILSTDLKIIREVLYPGTINVAFNNKLKILVLCNSKKITFVNIDSLIR